MLLNTHDDKKKELALFKYSLIAPLINDTYIESSKSQYFRNVASKEYFVDGKNIRFSDATIKNWYQKYKMNGIDGLFIKNRSDLGDSRKLSYSVKSRIIEILESFPHITAKAVYDKLIEEGMILKNDISLSSITRYVRNNYLKPPNKEMEMKAFEMPNPNDMWQADTSVGPYIKINGKKTKTYLILFIDDTSRLITNFAFFTEDNAVNMQLVFKDAISKHGVPKRLYVDNGGPYKNNQLALICASIGVHLIHTKPYTPTSKGKVERVFRTIKDGWMHSMPWDEFTSLEELNRSLLTFINNYHNKIHSSLKISPLSKFKEHLGDIKYIEPSKLEEHFLHRETRKVKNDSTISIRSLDFEVPNEFIAQKIAVRFFPKDKEKAFIYSNDRIIKIYPVKKVDNSKIRRTKISYGGVIND